MEKTRFQFNHGSTATLLLPHRHPNAIIHCGGVMIIDHHAAVLEAIAKANTQAASGIKGAFKQRELLRFSN
ncbi:MAG: hypothetical protein BWK78_04040 [Thiotrichaceae bacterium IS1]|nr:MAG: hypothetical protein BWK78_04040 [Thiotrichaceae bacterium IS1]